MTHGSDSRYLSRIMAVILVGLTFAGCVSMVLRNERPLFAEAAPAEVDP